jgi:hypothetical protein
MTDRITNGMSRPCAFPDLEMQKSIICDDPTTTTTLEKNFCSEAANDENKQWNIERKMIIRGEKRFFRSSKRKKMFAMKLWTMAMHFLALISIRMLREERRRLVNWEKFREFNILIKCLIENLLKNLLQH